MIDFWSIAMEHWNRYPKMEPQDFGKLAYQNEFGPAHLLQNIQHNLPMLLDEWKETTTAACPPESVGNGLCRFHITIELSAAALPLVGRLFQRTISETGRGGREGLLNKLAQLNRLDIPGWEAWCREYLRQGCLPVRHSSAFHTAYRPHYRLLRQNLAFYFPAFWELEQLCQLKKPVVAAVDGRCGSGKSSFAALLESVVPCQIVHMDDFYLPPDRREANWREIPGGNMDLKRFREEILMPAQAGRLTGYRRFNCQSGRLETVDLEGRSLTVVEGSYALHPAVREYYQWMLFLTCNPQMQCERLKKREGAGYVSFQDVWIPQEERYFAQCAVQKDSNMILDTSELFVS